MSSRQLEVGCQAIIIGGITANIGKEVSVTQYKPESAFPWHVERPTADLVAWQIANSQWLLCKTQQLRRIDNYNPSSEEIAQGRRDRLIQRKPIQARRISNGDKK